MLNDHQLRVILLEDYKLNGNEAMMYFIIRDLNFFSGECYASNEWLAEELNVSVWIVKGILSKLKSLGLIITTTDSTKGCIKKRYIYAKEEWLQVKVAKQEANERRKKIKDGYQVSEIDDSRGCETPSYDPSTRLLNNSVRGCIPTSHEVVRQPINNKYINNKEITKKESKESLSTFKSETELDEVETYGGLFDQPSTPNGMKEFSAPTPNQPAARPPSPDMDNSSEFLRGNSATIEDNPSEPIQVIGREGEKSFSEKKHGESKKSLQVGFSADMMAAWNSIAGEFDLARITTMTDARLRHAKAAVKAVGGIDNWVEGIKSQLRNSPFHRGENNRGWRANFDYYTRTDKALAAYEARYDKPQPRNSFEAAVDILFGKEM